MAASRPEGFASYFEPVDLCACLGCGHVFNAGFVPELASRIYVDSVLTNVPVDPSMHHRLVELSAWLPEESISGAKILEIGAGGGHLARILAAYARMVTVVEPCRALSAASLPEPNIRLIRSTFPVRSGDVEPCDLVVARQVLEHVHDPRQFLAGVADLTADQAYVYIEVPSLEYIVEYGAVLDLHVQHVQYFSRQNLIRLAQSVGLIPSKFLSIKEGHDLGILFRKAGTDPEVERPAQGGVPAAADPARLREAVTARFAQAQAMDLGALGRIALYGATMQAEVLLNLLPSTRAISMILDDNESYDGFGLYTAREWFSIRHYSGADLSEIDTIIVSAYLHDAVISQKLRSAGFRGRILSTRMPVEGAEGGGVPSLFRELARC